MSYYFSKTLVSDDFEEVVRCVVDVLKQYGFGVVSHIDMRDTLKKKINVDFRNYRILGACNPELAYEALLIEGRVGTMLPCNVVVRDLNDGCIEVVAIDPVASMQAIDNPELKNAAERIRERIKSVVESL